MPRTEGSIEESKSSKKAKDKKTESRPTKYSKQDILKSVEFSNIEKDFLSAALPEGKYTVENVKERLEKISKGAVK